MISGIILKAVINIGRQLKEKYIPFFLFGVELVKKKGIKKLVIVSID